MSTVINSLWNGHSRGDTNRGDGSEVVQCPCKKGGRQLEPYGGNGRKHKLSYEKSGITIVRRPCEGGDQWNRWWEVRIEPKPAVDAKCRTAEVCRKGTLGSVLAWRTASLLLIRLLFVLKPPLWERERGQAAEWACGGMTQEIHVFPTHGTFLLYLTTRIFYNATCSRNPK